MTSRPASLGPVFGALIAALLAGCAGGPPLATQYDPNYHPGDTLAFGADLPLIVEGRLGEVSGGALAASIAASLERDARPVHLVSSPVAGQPYRIVLAFGPNRATRPCARRPVDAGGVTLASGGTRPDVLAVLCLGDQIQAAAYAGPLDLDPALGAATRDALASLVRALFPARNPEKEYPDTI